MKVVVTIGSSSQNVQEEIDLGRGLNLYTPAGFWHGSRIQEPPKEIKSRP
jgi:hypothetical protein